MQTADGVLNIELGGTGPGADYDQLVVNGQATLGGTLNVVLLNGYVPSSGDQFRILTFSGRNGTTFATVNEDASLLPPVYGTTDVIVVAG
jgi:hypothetical protein